MPVDYLRLSRLLDLSAENRAITNIGSASTDFSATGGLTLADDLVLLDGIDLALGTSSSGLVRWSTADADNNTVVLALANANQSVHISDVGAVATDWNVAAQTHPTVYIHSDTTPATDYLLLGSHDGTTAVINAVGATTLNLQIDGTNRLSLTSTITMNASTTINLQVASVTRLSLTGTNTTISVPAGSNVSIGDDLAMFVVNGSTNTIAYNSGGATAVATIAFDSFLNLAGRGDGFYQTLEFNTVGAPTANISRGIVSDIRLRSNNDNNWTATVGVRGIETSGLRAQGGSIPSGVITGIAGIYNLDAVISGGAGSATVTNQYFSYSEVLTRGTNNIVHYAPQPGILDGIGATTREISYYVPTASVALGNQTATTVDIASAWYGIQTYTSTTLVRTVTNPSTVYIEGAPVASTNVVFTNGPYSMWIDGGLLRADGNILIGSTAINSGTNVLAVQNGSAPTLAAIDQIVLYSSDNSAGHTVPSFYCEGTQVLATAQADSVSSVRVIMRINGTLVTLLAI